MKNRDLKLIMLKGVQWFPLVLNLVILIITLKLIVFPPIVITSGLWVVLLLIGIILLLLSKALNYCVWHRLYIYLLLLFLVTIPIFFCGIIFIVHGVLLLLLIGLCIYFKKGLC